MANIVHRSREENARAEKMVKARDAALAAVEHIPDHFAIIVLCHALAKMITLRTVQGQRTRCIEEMQQMLADQTRRFLERAAGKFSTKPPN